MFYHPRTFATLRSWLALIAEETASDSRTIMARAGDIDPLLPSFLVSHHFPQVWPKLRQNFPSPGNLHRQFHIWFDGLKTFKLIRFFAAHRYPRLSLNDAFAALMTMAEAMPANLSAAGQSSSDILMHLRQLEGHTAK